MRSNNTLRNHHKKMQNLKNSQVFILEGLDVIFSVILSVLCYFLAGSLTGLWLHETNLWSLPRLTESNVKTLMYDGSFIELSYIRYICRCGLLLGSCLSILGAVKHLINACKALIRQAKRRRAINAGTVVEGPVKRFD